MQKFYETFGHAKTRIRYHMIFSTKYRRKCLDTIRDVVLESFRMAEQKSKLTIYEMEPDNDHIHFLINIPPSISVSDSIRLLKQYSTYYIYKNPYATIHLNWCAKRLLWTSGYFCSTIGEVSEETLSIIYRTNAELLCRFIRRT